MLRDKRKTDAFLFCRCLRRRLGMTAFRLFVARLPFWISVEVWSCFHKVRGLTSFFLYPCGVRLFDKRAQLVDGFLDTKLWFMLDRYSLPSSARFGEVLGFASIRISMCLVTTVMGATSHFGRR